MIIFTLAHASNPLITVCLYTLCFQCIFFTYPAMFLSDRGTMTFLCLITCCVFLGTWSKNFYVARNLCHHLVLTVFQLISYHHSISLPHILPGNSNYFHHWIFISSSTLSIYPIVVYCYLCLCLPVLEYIHFTKEGLFHTTS